MKKIVDAIKHLCNNLNIDYRYGTPDVNNEYSDTVAYPCVFFYIPSFTGNLQKANASGFSETPYRVTFDIRLRSELGQTDDERIDYFDFAKTTFDTLVFQLKHLRDANGNFIIKSYVSILGVFDKNKFDSNTDGTQCEFSVIPNVFEQIEVCPTPLSL